MSNRVTCVPVSFEALEDRMMLSVAPAVVHHPALHHSLHHGKTAVHATATAAPKSAVAKGGDPIYMNYAGITGEVTTAGHIGQIQLLSFQWGVGRGISSPTGGSANREAGAPSVSEITITKVLDKASPLLLQEALVGTGKDVKIFFANAVAGKVNTYAEYDLTNVLISGYHLSSGGDRPTESISLNFTKIQFKSFTHAANGSISTVTTGWDLSLGQITPTAATKP